MTGLIGFNAKRRKYLPGRLIRVNFMDFCGTRVVMVREIYQFEIVLVSILSHYACDCFDHIVAST